MMKLLLAGDNKDTAELTRMMLEMLGYQVSDLKGAIEQVLRTQLARRH